MKSEHRERGFVRSLRWLEDEGGLNDHLDSLEKSNPSERKLKKWFYTEWFQRRALVKALADALPPARKRTDRQEDIEGRQHKGSGSKSSTIKTERTIKPKRSENRLMAASVS